MRILRNSVLIGLAEILVGAAFPGGIAAAQPEVLPASAGNQGGVISNYTSSDIDSPNSIAAGPDGALWFTNYGGGTNNEGSIGRITTSGVVTDYTDPSIDEPYGITAGPDGAMWFTNSLGGPDGNGSIGRITTGGVVSNYTDPTIDACSMPTCG